LIDYALKTIENEYFNLVNFNQPDILESLWQLSLLKRELVLHFPDIFEFLTGIYIEANVKNGFNKEKLELFKEKQQNVLAKVIASADQSKFRDDIKPDTGIKLIMWALNGFAESHVTAFTEDSDGYLAGENYDRYMDDYREILDVLRKCFYKNN
jgi:hypothetical protein